MRWRNEVDVVTTACLQFQHHLRQALVSDFILELLFVSLRDLVVLAIDATKVAVAEEDVAGAFGANEWRFFAEVRGVRRDDWQPSGVTGSYLVVQTVVQTVARADGAALQQPLQIGDALFQRAVFEQGQIRGGLTHAAYDILPRTKSAMRPL